jgi:hypothetical protein
VERGEDGRKYILASFILGKVKRVLSYLKGNLHMPLILLADSLMLSRWWVDTAYAVHDDCRWHTGAGMSFGQGREWPSVTPGSRRSTQKAQRKLS